MHGNNYLLRDYHVQGTLLGAFCMPDIQAYNSLKRQELLSNLIDGETNSEHISSLLNVITVVMLMYLKSIFGGKKKTT